MKKITTLFKKNPSNLGLVINEINPENEWALDPRESVPTRKYDGTSCAIIDGVLFKRYDVKKGRQVPENAIPCQDPDPITGHWPHWIKCERDNPADKFHFEAFDNMDSQADGTYELCGPKIQGNPEKLDKHTLVLHGSKELHGLVYPINFENIKEYLTAIDIEGIVFHNKIDGSMCKIRKSDFGIKRTR